jgi:hypothetical protein
MISAYFVDNGLLAQLLLRVSPAAALRLTFVLAFTHLEQDGYPFGSSLRTFSSGGGF